jgi:hypothetical protein
MTLRLFLFFYSFFSFFALLLLLFTSRHVYITGKHEKSHAELKKLIELHGGTVAQTPSDKVTYYLGMMDGG